MAHSPEEPTTDWLRSGRKKNLSKYMRRQYERPLPIKVEPDGRTSTYFPWTYDGILVGQGVW